MCNEFRFEANYYENGKIKKDLFSDYAKDVVDCFLAEGKTKKEDLKKISLSYTQIRKFYNEVLKLKSDLEKKDDFKEILPYFRMLKAKAFAAYNTKPRKINHNFKTFIDKNVDYVGEDKEKFKIFCTFFEAVVAYSKGKFKE